MHLCCMKDEKWLKEQLLDKFLRYVKIDTKSDPHKTGVIPSTMCQWDLLNLLKKELEELGISKISLNEHGYLIAVLESNLPKGKVSPVIGLMAHVDTSPDMNGTDVKPGIIEDYDLKDILLGGDYILKPEEYPELMKHKGDTLIVTDGSTLLGADDKAGVAEIMTALSWFKANPDILHGEIEIIFTPDEETGKGLDFFNKDWLNAYCCYTIDGSELGSIEAECFNAAGFEIKFKGRVIHPGSARGKLINAVSMAGTFLGLFPANESPEATDGRYGYYSPMEISGNLDEAKLGGILRDFDTKELSRRIEALRYFGKAVEAKYPGGLVEVKTRKQYVNMFDSISKDEKVIEILEEAVKLAGVTPVRAIIRGGTDGSRLSEMGIPTPNIFTGGHNYHSRFEWASVNTMIKAADTIINLVQLWAEEKK
jgi:tripeptide aminopeptidase